MNRALARRTPFLAFLLFLLTLFSFPETPAARESGPDPRWAAFGRALCETKGEGIFFERYDNGEVKASVVCAEHGDDTYVKKARYFDSHGRGAANEENDPANPAASRYLEWVYDADMGPPAESRLYDGSGKLIEKKPFVAARPAAPSAIPWVPVTYNGYLNLCRTQPAAALGWMPEAPTGREFFAEAACPCLAEKAVRVDEERDADFMAARGLDPASPADRLAVAAARSLSSCLCDNFLPGSRLEEVCRKAPAVERAWRRPD